MTDILDILYTPINVKPVPVFDRSKLNDWCKANQIQTIQDRADGSKITVDDIYPWNIVYARKNANWLGGFDQHFPELAEYFYSAFSLQESELRSTVLLPMKSHYVGSTYWHADPDEIGLRLYLENDEIDRDFLLIKPTKKKYQSREELGKIPENGITPKVQDITYSAKILKSHNGFYLNNVRSIHTVNVDRPNSIRLAVLIITEMKADKISSSVKDLIVQSAEKYSDLSIRWTP
jgi:hypothetical protein